ncbi:hypothetical protein V494_03315 [Pseudogymnoascus sp. VKM F-4513 (FW-928)]|nr:hypothetical protein V494_03315 [Pseudogymnoascus sp. VKM F-4513 (FW-928)]
MPTLEARRVPLEPTDRGANQAAKMPGILNKKSSTQNNPRTKNVQVQDAELKNRAQHEIYEDVTPHADPELFHELVEEPDLVFGEDIDALGVTHAGQPESHPTAKKTVRIVTDNVTRQAHQGNRQDKSTDPDIHADPALFHELVEEPDLVFAEDIDALGVTHAGNPDPSRLTRKYRRAKGNTRSQNLAKRFIRVRHARPSAEDLYWDDGLIHEVVEEPEYIFGEDIDALGVSHAGGKTYRSVGNAAKPAHQPRRYARVKRAVPSTDDLYWDADVMHEVVEEPEYIFGDDFHALGVRHAGIPDPPRRARRRLRIKRAVPTSGDRDLHWDDNVMHEVVEEPDAIFGSDIDALGVTHAGVSETSRSAKPMRKVARNATKPVHGSRHRLKRQHADPRLFHELVEEPDAVFGEDIDALGVQHAGVPDGFQISVGGVRLKIQVGMEGETLITMKFPSRMQSG